ncbi:MAG: DUF1989 domain-containing protein [Candidatus Puniceispirillaceae bacterium]
MVIYVPHIYSAFSNIGHKAGGRVFHGFASSDDTELPSLHPRQIARIDVCDGDLVRFAGDHGDAQLALLAFDENGQRQEHHLGWDNPERLSLTPLCEDDFESDALRQWVLSKGGDFSSQMKAFIVPSLEEAVILRPASVLTLWAVNLQTCQNLVLGDGNGVISVWHKTPPKRLTLPQPSGQIRDEFTIPRGTAKAYELYAGEHVQIIDAEGQQCSDFQSLRLAGLHSGSEDFIDSTATRSMVRRAYPSPGLFDKFYDAHMRPLLRVVQDTCGRHDTFGLACTARSYEDRGYPGHLNCSDNMSFALEPFGVGRKMAWPAINLFWNTWLDENHQIMTEESHSRAGDYVIMEALDDLACVSTACPDDIDPINGWNPTDIHIRIYKKDTQIQPAIAYRKKEDSAMQISKPSPFHDRISALTNHFAPARDLWAAVSFPASGAIGEYWACREAATLQDMSGLRKIDIIGPDAEKLLQYTMTRDIAKLAIWRGTYSLLCDDTGAIIDDGTLFKMAPQLFRWCCGSEESGRWLADIADKKGWQVRIQELGNSLPNLALQGPKSRDILKKIIFTQPHVPAIDQIKWFGATIGRLHDREGAPFMLTRSGYTGELGYEIFCAEKDALAIWDALMNAGGDDGLIPMGSEALDIIRIEAGLAGANEFTPGHDALEAGLGFAIDDKTADFIGKQALARNAGAIRKKLVGLKFSCDDVPSHGAPVYAGERQIGMITSATRSPKFECAIAFARVAVEYAETGTKLEAGQLDGRMKRLEAVVTDIPFFDAKRERARA